MKYHITEYGEISNKKVSLITIKNDCKNVIQIINYGAMVHSWFCPDKFGVSADILLGCRSFVEYLNGHPYFGAIVGRYANRIAYGRFSLDGLIYQLDCNLPPHHLHGGISGFDKKIWDFEIKEGTHNISIICTARSIHLEEGYPGNLDVTVTYTFNNENELLIEYLAHTDRNTPINLTNHSYFNLSGDQSKDILDHKIQISADYVTDIDDTLIPTGKLLKIPGSNLDFLDYHSMGERIFANDQILKKANGYDHNYILNDHSFSTRVASVVHTASGRTLEVYTTEPAVQFYTGNWLNGIHGKPGSYKSYAGFCLETQHFPDTPNHQNFPSTILRPGESYYSKTVYKMIVES